MVDDQPIAGKKQTALSPEELEFLKLARMNLLSPGDLVDERYEILDTIAIGGCGCIYKVRQVFSRRVLALKTLVEVSEKTLARLRKEALAASRLDHQNIVKAVDFGIMDGNYPYVVLEFIEGPNLAEYLKEQGHIPLDDTLDLVLPVCQALQYASEQGVTHRDIKPSNILLTPGNTACGYMPKIVDFGLAKTQYADETNSKLTRTGELLGTPYYMSPEQACGGLVDTSSDVYSVGCLMFELLTGKPPYSGKGSLDVIQQHKVAPIPLLNSGGLTVPKGLNQCIAKMLAKERSARYQSFQDVITDLSKFSRPRRSNKTTKQPASPVANYFLIAFCALIAGITLGIVMFMLFIHR